VIGTWADIERRNDGEILYIFIIYVYVYCYRVLYFLWSV